MILFKTQRPNTDLAKPKFKETIMTNTKTTIASLPAVRAAVGTLLAGLIDKTIVAADVEAGAKAATAMCRTFDTEIAAARAAIVLKNAMPTF